MRKVQRITGRLDPSVAFFRVLGAEKLWRCHACQVLCVRRDNKLFDPSEDGGALVQHPCEFAVPAHVKTSFGSTSLGGRARYIRGHREGGNPVRHCRLFGCQEPVGMLRKYFCRQHYRLLTPGLRSSLESAYDREAARLVKVARAFIRHRLKKAVEGQSK